MSRNCSTYRGTQLKERCPDQGEEFMARCWHYFLQGNHYSKTEILAACDQQLSEVKDPEGKKQRIEKMKRHAPETVVWSPFSSGWGCSPFNPNCWKTADGEPILPTT
jgi:hypothetical protein